MAGLGPRGASATRPECARQGRMFMTVGPPRVKPSQLPGTPDSSSPIAQPHPYAYSDPEPSPPCPDTARGADASGRCLQGPALGPPRLHDSPVDCQGALLVDPWPGRAGSTTRVALPGPPSLGRHRTVNVPASRRTGEPSPSDTPPTIVAFPSSSVSTRWPALSVPKTTRPLSSTMCTRAYPDSPITLTVWSPARTFSTLRRHGVSGRLRLLTTTSSGCSPGSGGGSLIGSNDHPLSASQARVSATPPMGAPARESRVGGMTGILRSLGSRATATLPGGSQWHQCRCERAAIHGFREVSDALGPRG